MCVYGEGSSYICSKTIFILSMCLLYVSDSSVSEVSRIS